MMSMRKRIAGLSPDEIRALGKSELDEQPITGADFAAAMKKTNKSVSSSDLKKYDAWMKDYGST